MILKRKKGRKIFKTIKIIKKGIFLFFLCFSKEKTAQKGRLILKIELTPLRPIRHISVVGGVNPKSIIQV